MITRYAMFEGSVKAGQTEAFRAAVMETLLPKWKAFPAALAVRVTFAEARDDGAPEFSLILAVNYPDRAAVDAALASPARAAREGRYRCRPGPLLRRAHPPSRHRGPRVRPRSLTVPGSFDGDCRRIPPSEGRSRDAAAQH